MKKLLLLCLTLTAILMTALAQPQYSNATRMQILFIANATQQTIDRIELTDQALPVQSISGVGDVKGLRLEGKILYSFNADYDVYATQLDGELRALRTDHLGNIAAAGRYAGNSIQVERDGSILTAGSCGVALFTRQAGSLMFQAVRFSGLHIVRFSTDSKNRLYMLAVDGAVFRVSRSRDWSNVQDTGWRIPRPSGFQIDGKSLVGATASARLFNAPLLCSQASQVAAAVQPSPRKALIPEGISGLIRAKPDRQVKVITIGAPLFLNPTILAPCGVAVLDGAGFVLGTRTDQQSGSEIFRFDHSGVVVSVLKSSDEFTDIILVQR